MQTKLLRKNLSVRTSPIEGYGVFAEENIGSGEIVEECHVINSRKKHPEYINYYFSNKTVSMNILPSGFGAIYNHSEDPNVAYEYDEQRQLMVFSTRREIKLNEELVIFYGDHWFEERDLPIKKAAFFWKLKKFLIAAPLRGLVIIGALFLIANYMNDVVHGKPELALSQEKIQNLVKTIQQGSN